MAVTKKPIPTSFQALTAAALVLPGLISPRAHGAEGDEVDFQYSHYQEGKRTIAITDGGNIASGKSFNPIEVDSLHGSARVSLTDRVKFAFNYLQDTWGGATPVATMPFLANQANNLAFTSNKGSHAVVGASPYVAISQIFVDPRFLAMAPTDRIDPNTGNPIYAKNGQSSKLTHVMATASPETRKQGDFKLSYDWDEASINLGGGVSIEDDYDSRFGSIGGRFDFNQRQTVLTADLSYTNSYTHAIRDHDSYVRAALIPANQFQERNVNQGDLFQGIRQDWSTHLGVTQVLNKTALLGADFSYTRSTGYLSNPYKGVSILFVDPDPDYQRNQGGSPPTSYFASISTFYEKRPEVRNQFSLGGKYVQYLEALNAALHFNYQFSADDWDIQAHTFDADWVQPLADGWTVTPRIRYYSQDAASFYTPYLVSKQAESKPAIDGNGQPIFIGSNGKDYFISNNGLVDAQGNPPPPSVSTNPKNVSFNPKLFPAYYSSDQRLSGFGALSGGVTIAKQFAKGISLETGFEYYTHQGALKLGGQGEGSYADFDYWLANAALKINLDSLAFSPGSDHEGHHSSAHHHGAQGPAGVMFEHMLPKAGDFMAGYRFMWSSQSGDMLNGTNPVGNALLKTSGCAGDPCYLTPSHMSMSMHMLDLMYAPTDWLTLMLMPQFVDMHMDMRGLYGLPSDTGLPTNELINHYAHHLQNGHETGGIGDLGMYALFKLFDDGMHHFHVTAGLSAPIGDVDLKFRRNHKLNAGYEDYGMQLGSGTWDLKPSLTYTGHLEQWSWGAQASGTVRMEQHNKSGYRLGDLFQATAWGGYNLTPWLTATVRGVYTWQGSIAGQFSNSSGQFTDPRNPLDGETKINAGSILKFGPNDYPRNYGGRFWDVGFGLSATVPSGDFAGNRLAVEWLQPVYTDFNGYQLDRDGALSATWNLAF